MSSKKRKSKKHTKSAIFKALTEDQMKEKKGKFARKVARNQIRSFLSVARKKKNNSTTKKQEVIK